MFFANVFMDSIYLEEYVILSNCRSDFSTFCSIDGAAGEELESASGTV
jgi:hypothetical protein